ncbi:MAG: alkaline phosphatase [Polyangiaceae bacterium]|nr:alkaline phosphatase [Polyangiaceae bacterium]
MRSGSKAFRIGLLVLVLAVVVGVIVGSRCPPGRGNDALDSAVARAASVGPPAAGSETPSPRAVSGTPRFVLLFIGDGMGPSVVALAEQYLAGQSGGDGTLGASPSGLAFTGFPVKTMVTTQSADGTVTDSAASGTAIATGHRTKNGFLGVGRDGRSRLESVAVFAHRCGMRVGLLSSVSLDHATPAAFYAHQVGRTDYGAIAQDLLGSGIDLFGGGGLLAGKRPGGVSSTSHPIWQKLMDRGYAVARIAADGDGGLAGVTGLPAFVTARELDDESLPYELDRPHGAPRLADFTQRAIALLGTDRGFFMMVEGGKIDWACHANDAATAAAETVELSAAVAVATESAARHPGEALVIVTADHDTGGLQMVAGGGEGIAVLRGQTKSYAALSGVVRGALRARPGAPLAALAPLMEPVLGIRITAEVAAELEPALAASRGRHHPRSGERSDPADGRPDPLVEAAVHVLARRAGLRWSTAGHTSLPVELLANGAAADRFAAVTDNAAVGRVLVELVSTSDLGSR